MEGHQKKMFASSWCNGVCSRVVYREIQIEPGGILYLKEKQTLVPYLLQGPSRVKVHIHSDSIIFPCFFGSLKRGCAFGLCPAQFL